MALSNAEKNLLISALEKSLADAIAAAGVSDLAQIETDVGALRTAFDADPATATAADIVAAIDEVQGCQFSSLVSTSAVISEAREEAGS